jgi:diaminopimelate decarboxylase
LTAVEWLGYRDGLLTAEGVDLTDVAERFGTPAYVYSSNAIVQRWRAYDAALQGQPHLICYAVKANSNLAVLKLLADLGSGFDIVSAGELERVIRAGGDPQKIVFSGVGKTDAELRRALEAGIGCINAESTDELERLDKVAADLNVKAGVALRLNPDVDPNTHPYIATGLNENKFGIPIDEARAAVACVQALPHLELRGIGCHIGSQLTDAEPVLEALDGLLDLADAFQAQGIELEHIDVGGGLGVRYGDEAPPPIDEFCDRIRAALGRRTLTLLLEPGRSIVAEAGILLTRVIAIKTTRLRRFVIVDAAMNDLLRPALYNAWQPVLPIRETAEEGELSDLVGPVCESGDFLARARRLDVEPDDLLAVGVAGAYGFVMSSNYNTRPRACELMLSDGVVHLVRRRETLDDLLDPESTLDG